MLHPIPKLQAHRFEYCYTDMMRNGGDVIFKKIETRRQKKKKKPDFAPIQTKKIQRKKWAGHVYVTECERTGLAGRPTCQDTENIT